MREAAICKESVPGATVNRLTTTSSTTNVQSIQELLNDALSDSLDYYESNALPISLFRRSREEIELNTRAIIRLLIMQCFVLWLLLFSNNFGFWVPVASGQGQEPGAVGQDGEEQELEDTGASIEEVECNSTPEPGVDLEGCDLSKANLTNANLSQSDLTNVNLAHANLTNTILSASLLGDADLFYANLAGANLTNANLTNANLAHANLTDAFLINADFNAANLTKANLVSTRIEGANFSGAITTNCAGCPT